MIVLACGTISEGDAIPIDEIQEEHLYGYWFNCPGYPSYGIDNFSTSYYCNINDDGSYEVYESLSYHKRHVQPSEIGTYTFIDRNLTLSGHRESVRIIGHCGSQLVYKTNEGNDLFMSRARCKEVYCKKDKEYDWPEFSEQNCRNWEN